MERVSENVNERDQEMVEKERRRDGGKEILGVLWRGEGWQTRGNMEMMERKGWWRKRDDGVGGGGGQI
jgi:hypothetical protein